SLNRERLRPSGAWRQDQAPPVSLPGVAPAVGLQEQRAQRRQGQVEAVQVAVAWDRRRVDAAKVALTTSAVDWRVAVQHLQPPPRCGRADLVVLARNGREVERGYDHLVLAAPADEADHALLGVGAVDP